MDKYPLPWDYCPNCHRNGMSCECEYHGDPKWTCRIPDCPWPEYDEDDYDDEEDEEL
jgi:hypothetical protein